VVPLAVLAAVVPLVLLAAVTALALLAAVAALALLAWSSASSCYILGCLFSYERAPLSSPLSLSPLARSLSSTLYPYLRFVMCGTRVIDIMLSFTVLVERKLFKIRQAIKVRLNSHSIYAFAI
jgi:hypothetical protein